MIYFWAYAALSLTFTGLWALGGWRAHTRAAIRDEYRWWSSPVIEHRPASRDGIPEGEAS